MKEPECKVCGATGKLHHGIFMGYEEQGERQSDISRSVSTNISLCDRHFQEFTNQYFKD